MTFKEFMNELRGATNDFEKMWEKRMQAHPDQYPNEMLDGDWWEQFITFSGDTDDE